MVNGSIQPAMHLTFYMVTTVAFIVLLGIFPTRWNLVTTYSVNANNEVCICWDEFAGIHPLIDIERRKSFVSVWLVRWHYYKASGISSSINILKSHSSQIKCDSRYLINKWTQNNEFIWKPVESVLYWFRLVRGSLLSPVVNIIAIAKRQAISKLLQHGTYNHKGMKRNHLKRVIQEIPRDRTRKYKLLCRAYIWRLFPYTYIINYSEFIKM